ncbi:MAG: flavin reductase family protein [Nocardioides sp.]
MSELPYHLPQPNWLPRGTATGPRANWSPGRSPVVDGTNARSPRVPPDPPSTVASDLRGVMRNFATGVCVATTYSEHAGGRQHDAVTVNSLTSISLDPPLISLCLRLESAFGARLLSTKKWAVSILNSDEREIAGLLAKDQATRQSTVRELPASPGCHTGALVFDSASWLECVLWDSFDVGDHTLVVGQVVAMNERRHNPALVLLQGSYHALGGLDRSD